MKRYECNARMSKAVIQGGVAYLSGQVPDDRGAPFAVQCQSVLSKIETILRGVGSDKLHLISATVYLKSMDDFAAMNQLWEAWLVPGCAPARTTVRADMNTPDTLIEVTVSACCRESGS